MAKLATKRHLIASLNVLVASRARTAPEEALTKDEIVDIMLAMAQNSGLVQETRGGGYARLCQAKREVI